MLASFLLTRPPANGASHRKRSKLSERLIRLLFPLGSVNAPAPMQVIVRRYASYTPVIVLLGIAASAFEGLGIGMLAPLLAMMLNDTDVGLYPWALQMLVNFVKSSTTMQPLMTLSVVVFSLVLCKSIIQALNGCLMARVEGNAGRDIRNALAEKALQLNYEFFMHNDANCLVTIVDTDSWKTTDAIRAIFTIAVSVSTAAVFASLLLFADWRLFAIVCTGGALIRAFQAKVSRHLSSLGQVVVSANHVLGEHMIQVIRSIRVIQIFGQELNEFAAFRSSSERVRTSMLNSDQISVLYVPIIEIVLSLVILGVLLVANQLQIGLPTIVAFLVLLYRIQSPLLIISQSSLRLAELQGSIDKVEWLLAADGLAANSPSQAEMTLELDQPLCFENVSYSYGEQSPKKFGVDKISFEIAPHSMVALIGRSGAGKSTVVNLLCRLVEPDAGRIMLGEVDITREDIRSWRSHLAVAGQDLELIAGTAAANIAYGMPGASKEAIEEAARVADAHDFITSLPQGYDTMLGALGFSLSGGQRQRIGLARALIRQPEILILDEATSAVDGISERTIIHLLSEHRLFGRAIVISHRLETLRACTTAIELAHGKVVFQGPFHESAWFKMANEQSDGKGQT